ncbi:MAG: DUF1292 domain-containing protein [Clostridia bacterium]|nr:DUF1292 domain-containing protein [Clostridia bacterium]
MSEEYGNDIVTLTDEEGNEIELEHLDTLEYNGSIYMAFVPVVESPEEVLDESMELVILKVEEEDGEELLVTVDDDGEAETVFELFAKRLENVYFDDEEDPEAE